jgi:hypothetical protein
MKGFRREKIILPKFGGVEIDCGISLGDVVKGASTTVTPRLIYVSVPGPDLLTGIAVFGI